MHLQNRTIHPSRGWPKPAIAGEAASSSSSATHPCIDQHSLVKDKKIHEISQLICTRFAKHRYTYQTQLVLASQNPNLSQVAPNSGRYYSKDTIKTSSSIARNNAGDLFVFLSPHFAASNEKKVYLVVNLQTFEYNAVAKLIKKALRPQQATPPTQSELQLPHILNYRDHLTYQGKKGQLKDLVWMDFYESDLIGFATERVFGSKKRTTDLYTVSKDCMLALQELHSGNIEHRDIKPDNYLLNTTIKPNGIKLTDLESASKVENILKSLTVPGVIIPGTNCYASPERLKSATLLVMGQEYLRKSKIMDEEVTRLENKADRFRRLAEQYNDTDPTKTINLLRKAEHTDKWVEKGAKHANRFKRKGTRLIQQGIKAYSPLKGDIYALALTLFIVKYQYNPLSEFLKYKLTVDYKAPFDPNAMPPPQNFWNRQTSREFIQRTFKHRPKSGSFNQLLMHMLSYRPNSRPSIDKCLERLEQIQLEAPETLRYVPFSLPK